MSLIVPGGRPNIPQTSSPVPVDYAFNVVVDKNGEVQIVHGKVKPSRAPSPDEVYGAAEAVVQDGPEFLLTEPLDEEYSFLVLKMTNGKIMLAPSVDLEVAPLREATSEHIVHALAAIKANILAMKTADLLMAVSQAQQSAMQNADLVRNLKLG